MEIGVLLIIYTKSADSTFKEMTLLRIITSHHNIKSCFNHSSSFFLFESLYLLPDLMLFVYVLFIQFCYCYLILLLYCRGIFSAQFISEASEPCPNPH